MYTKYGGAGEESVHDLHVRRHENVVFMTVNQAKHSKEPHYFVICTLFRCNVIHTCTIVIKKNDSVFIICGTLTFMFIFLEN